MFETETIPRAFEFEKSLFSRGFAETEAQLPCREDILELALDLLERGRASEADNLLTAALLENPDDENLWLAAGFCRLRRGAARSAAAAFQMGAWLTDDEMIREILSLLEEIAQ